MIALTVNSKKTHAMQYRFWSTTCYPFVKKREMTYLRFTS
jgi:hypothetical protein